MNHRILGRLKGTVIFVCLCALGCATPNRDATAAESTPAVERRFLYAAEPGIRDYLEYGGHGVLIFDIDHGHKFVKRIPARGLDEKGRAR